METNATPFFDTSDNVTGCCPRFNPAGWADQELHFRNKPFLKAKTKSLFHIPLNVGPVFMRAMAKMDAAHARDDQHFLVLSEELSPWAAAHYFAVSRPVPDADGVTLNGDFRTKVFEGPYKDAPKWEAQMRRAFEACGDKIGKTYFFYTTCPKCAKAYGKNYVVGVAELLPQPARPIGRAQ